jgi:alkaline phosphatase D
MSKNKLSRTSLGICCLVLSGGLADALRAADSDSVYMANGIKIGEVSATSAIVWARLTQSPERNLQGTAWSEDSTIPAGKTLGEMQDAAPGAVGEVRVEWSLEGKPARASNWLPVDPERDFTRQIQLRGLLPGEHYTIRVSSRSLAGKAGQQVTGAVRTAPSAQQAAPVRFTVVTGQEFHRRDDDANGHQIYERMLDLDPDFFIHTGDIVYYDKPSPNASSLSLARYKWNRMYGLSFQRSFHNAVGSYFMKDDHDTLKNDCWPPQTYGDLTWNQGLAIFREQVPMGDSTYRTIRWGKDLQVWLVEGRDFRSANNMPDGPDKTIWGAKQKQWFYESVRESDATFRLLISPTPIVGPDRGKKNDNHANKGFTHEGSEIREFLSKQKNMFVVCGDRHWQYVSVDPATGVREYSCGPTSMKHAGGFSKNQQSDMHRYLNVVGGFLAVDVERQADKPVAIFRHHGVDGSVLHEDIMEAQTE